MTEQLWQHMEALIHNTISNGMQEFGNQISSQLHELANSWTSPASLPDPVATALAMRGGWNGGWNVSNRSLGFPVRRSNATLTRAVHYFSYLNFVFNLRSRVQKSIREYFEKVAPRILEMAVGRDEATQFENEWKANPGLVSCTGRFLCPLFWCPLGAATAMVKSCVTGPETCCKTGWRRELMLGVIYLDGGLWFFVVCLVNHQ